MADKARVERVDLRHGDDFPGGIGGKWPQNMHHCCGGENVKVVGQCLSACLTGGRESGQLAQAAALGPQQLEKPEEGIPLAD